MARPTRTKKDDTKNIKEVAKQVAREALLEMNTQEEEGPDDDTLSFIDTASDITSDKSVQDPTGFDIFADVGDPRTEKGDIIRYVIRKWGQHIATKFHPYSWEELHEEYGAGNYQVIARSDSTKKFVKSESRIIGDARSPNKKAVETAEVDTQTPPPNQGLGFMELFTLLQEQQKQAKEEAREVSRESQQTQNQMMILVAELLKSNSSSGASSSVQMMQMITQMMQQQQQTTNQMFEKLADSQTRLFDKINERIEKVSEKKSTEFDMFNKGMEMFSKMNELAEKRAQYQLELLEEAKEEARGDSGGDDEPKKKSITDSLIEGILPVVSQALVTQNNPALVQQQQAALLRQQALQRRQLQIAAARRAQANRKLQAGAGNKEARVANQNAKVETTSAGEVEVNEPTSGPSVGPDIIKRNGLPSVSIGLKTVSTQSTEPEVLDFSGEDEEELKDTPEQSVKDSCREILPEFLGKLMLEQVPSNAAAAQTLELLKTHGISREEFLEHVAADDLLEVGKEYGLPEQAFEWLNELYAYIQSKPGNGIRGKTRADAQPTA